jgi:hypothetical protein
MGKEGRAMTNGHTDDRMDRLEREMRAGFEAITTRFDQAARLDRQAALRGAPLPVRKG